MLRLPPPPLLAFCLAGIALADPLPLRQPNPALNVPPAPPATAYSLVNALPGLSFTEPVCLASPAGDLRRLFVVEKGGKIWVVPDVTSPSPVKALFLDLVTLVNSRTGQERLRASFTESGLLGLAFHPDHAVNGHFFVFYTPGLGTGSTPPMHERLSRFTTRTDNPNLADTASEFVLFDQRDEADNHNGGCLQFGPDGYLYVSLGDEGNQNDQRFNAQRIDKDFFSGILRLDVDKRPGNLEPNPHPNPNDYPTTPPPDAVKRDGGIARYSIPADNPFAGATTFNGLPVSAAHVRSEFWAVGLRNPWRFSFDPATGQLWCGDVGGFRSEEINLITKGGNYGWVYREGHGEGPWDNSSPAHPAPPAGFNPIGPIYAYPHSGASDLSGDSVIGGIVYRGPAIGALFGKYLFADYGSGNLWSMNPDGSKVERITGEGGISSFGIDPSNQDLLVTDTNSNRILRLSASPAGGSFPVTLGETGLFSNVASLTPAPGLVPYEVNLPFWSDHAIKRRWFTVPDPAARFTVATDEHWSLPPGTVWVKHFDLEMDRGVPASRKRIETRLLVKNAGGAYGVSYRWNAAGTEATLVEDGGVSFPLAVVDQGVPAPQTWTIPGRAQCMICHTPQAGHALSFNTRQLNLDFDLLGHSGNQLTTLAGQGYFTNDPGSPNLLPRHLRPDESAFPLEARVRSYLAVNCAYCHQDGGTALGDWDGSPHLTLDQTGLVNGAATQNGGDPLKRLVVPGDSARSVVPLRMAASGGFTRMPPLGSSVIDAVNVTLVTEWINGELAGRVDYHAWRALHFEPDLDPAGAPGEDPDGDGGANHDEYLAGTDPRDGSSAFRPSISADPSALRFHLPANRSFHIESSVDLISWPAWDIPQNQGLPVASGLVEIPFPRVDRQRFFRIDLREN